VERSSQVFNRLADATTMRSKASAAMGASSTWVVAAAFVLALVSILVVTALQVRANSSRDAEVMLGKIGRDFDALQSIPWDGLGEDAATQAAVLKRMQASQQRIESRLALLRRDHSSPHLFQLVAPYRKNVATLATVHRLIARHEDEKAYAVGPLASPLQHKVGRELGRAGVQYQHRASRSLMLATLGSAGMIIALVSLFAVFYLRSHTSHATAQRLTRENARLLVEDAQLQVIQRLALAAEYRDDATGQHTRRVGELSARIGEALGMPDDELALLRQAAPLHDVGKIAIPDSILLKPGGLTSDEFEQMKAHTTVGAAMLSGRGLALLEMAETIALTHHERWDGCGYPAGLSGSDIPRVGRIVAIADVFDALTHARPYKEAWSVGDAMTEIIRQSGRQFDPEVVDAFLRVLPDPGLEQVLADRDEPAAEALRSAQPMESTISS
jgi:HD-GYP domain-containing protein (c-di-GMP phosphodiesterase class II)